MVPGRPPPSPAVLTHARPSPIVPCHPHPPPAVLKSPRPSSHIPGRPDSSPAVPGCPSPLPCTNMSHPVGPAVLPKDGRPTASRPVPSGALGSLPAGPRRAPRRLRTLSPSSRSETLYNHAVVWLCEHWGHRMSGCGKRFDLTRNRRLPQDHPFSQCLYRENKRPKKDLIRGVAIKGEQDKHFLAP